MNRIVGRSRFALERLPRAPRGPFALATQCLMCDRAFAVEPGAMHAVFRIGSEVVGIVCDGCLSHESRARLARLRETTTKAATR